jgi:hypothetical protein
MVDVLKHGVIAVMEANSVSAVSSPGNENAGAIARSSGASQPPQIGPPRDVREWLLLMEECPSVLQTMGKNPQQIARYQTALAQWKELGYPDPESVFAPDLVQNIQQVVSSYNRQPTVFVPDRSLKLGVAKDDLDRVLQIIDGGLDALSPPFSTAREISDSERELCKLGLNLAKFALQSVNSLRVSHKE